MLNPEESEVLALAGSVPQTSSMRASRKYPQFHEDRKAQKLLDRIDKKLQAKNVPQNSPQAAPLKQSSSAA